MCTVGDPSTWRCIDSLKRSINWFDVMSGSLPHQGSPLRYAEAPEFPPCSGGFFM